MGKDEKRGLSLTLGKLLVNTSTPVSPGWNRETLQGADGWMPAAELRGR